MNFDWNNPYPGTRRPVYASNMVAASQPLAAQAGLRILARGGNAVDAAIAAAATQALTEPTANGLGSDCCAIVWDGSRLHGLNASGAAPAAWNLDYFRRKHQGRIPARGWDSVTVPGCVAGWAALHEKLGRMSFADVLEPAIEYAERGYAVSAAVQRKWAAQADELQPQPGYAEHFLPRGRPPQVGEHFVLQGAAATLKRIAASGGRDFYEGETAHKLVAHAQAHDAVLTLADLRDYAPQWTWPVGQTYRGHTLHQLAPGGQGIAALLALGMLQHFDVAARPVDHPDTQHLLIEAMKLAQADAGARRPGMTPEDLLQAGHLAERARLIDPAHARRGAGGNAPHADAICLSAVDRNGMMVSLAQSNHMGFGSGVVVPGTGVSLQNGGHGFSADAGHPDAVAGGKRPAHAALPAFLMRDGAPVMSFGVVGGDMQPQGQVQALVRMLDYGQQPQAACDAPRWRWRHGQTLDVEAGLAPSVAQGLLARGHALLAAQDPGQDFGSGQFIWRLGDPAVDGYVGASDGRRDGLAAGF